MKGTFREISGKGTVSPSGEVSGRLMVAAASIHTKNAKRDRHLRSADFFDSDNYPTITFEATSIQPAGQNAIVSGTLRVRDHSMPLSFRASPIVRNSHLVSLDATIRVDRSKVGLTWKGLGASTLNILTVHAVFTRP